MVERCLSAPFQLLISELQKKGNRRLATEVAFKVGVKGAPAMVKRYYNRCISRYPGQNVFCTSISWSVYCANNSKSSHCKNFV